MPRLDLSEYAAYIAERNGWQTMVPVIEKELLHYEILSVLSEAGLLAGIVFQGGTCLRLCYGANRYSEDLDFAGGRQFDAKSMHEVKACLENALPQQFLVSASVKEPVDDTALVKKWRIKVDTSPERPDIPAQKISLEIASIPAYTKLPRMLQVNYEGLPAGYEDIILNAESLEEVLADKLESFVCSPQIRYRDLWDMNWLAHRPTMDLESAYKLRELKENDYGEQERFKAMLSRVQGDLEATVEGPDFKQQMKRFLPTAIFDRTIGDPMYRKVLTQTIQDLYSPFS